MFRPCARRSVLSFLPLLILAGCADAAPAEPPATEPLATEPLATESAEPAYEQVCLSLRVLARESSREQLAEEVETLAGIGWVDGLVIDPAGFDVVLLGRRIPGRPTLHLDDLVVSLRNIWNREPPPYCSLDPRPEDMLALERFGADLGAVKSAAGLRQRFERLGRDFGPQVVVVAGVPRDSRQAHVMVEADYHMKKLSQGLAQLDGVTSLFDLFREETRRRMREPNGGSSISTNMMSRFWFHVESGDPAYQEADGALWLERCRVVVMTESQRCAADGTLYDSYEDNPYAQRFARELSGCMTRSAEAVPVFADLENLFRLNALLRALHHSGGARQARLDLRYWLHGYGCVAERPMPASLPGLTNGREERCTVMQSGALLEVVAFPMVCGGVSMDFVLDRERFAATASDWVRRLRWLVVRSRPGPEALWWPMPKSGQEP